MLSSAQNEFIPKCLATSEMTHSSKNHVLSLTKKVEACTV